MWQVFLMYALFGSIFSIGKLALVSCPPFFLTAVRMLLAGCLLFLFENKSDVKKQLVKSPKFIPLILQISLFNVFITNAFEFWGLQYMSSSKTCLIYTLSPFASALIAYVFSLEKMTRKKWEGLTVGILSFIPLMISPWIFETKLQLAELEKWAEVALAISALTSVIGWYSVRKLMNAKEFSPNFINGSSFIIGGLISLFVSLLIETIEFSKLLSFRDFILPLIYIVLIHNIICYTLYVRSLRRFSVTFMAFAGLINPLFAAVFGYLFLNEPVTPSFILAFLGMSVGLMLFYKEETKTIYLDETSRA